MARTSGFADHMKCVRCGSEGAGLHSLCAICWWVEHGVFVQMVSERKESKMKMALFAIIVLALVSIALGLEGCAPARSNGSIEAVSIPGPWNRSCYAIVQNGVAVGGSCL